MNSVSAARAHQFVAGLELPAPRRGGYESADTVHLSFEAAKNQAMVVGSDIVSFVSRVTPERREDIVNSSMLAQLAAKKKVGDPTKIYEWYDAYFDVLLNIGWVVQDRSFATYTEAGQNLEAHEAILHVAASLLGPAATSLTVVRATLGALKSMSGDSPWITLFNRESQSANTARFQVTLAERGEANQFLVSLMAFGLEASATLTQVLFFKFKASEATLKHYAGRVTIDSAVLSSVRDQIRQKVTSHASSYIKALPDLG